MMGDMADYYIEKDIDRMSFNFDDASHIDNNELELIFHNLEWSTRDGRKVPIKDMEDTHLLNSKNMMERNGHSKHIIYLRLQEEIKNRNLQEGER